MKSFTLDETTVAAMRACVDHARNLIASAKAVRVAGHSSIAYHLSALALEELGKRHLIGLQAISQFEVVPPAWPAKHTQDHVKKLFWCFFGAEILSDKLTNDALEKMQGLAGTIHEKRLAGLYVELAGDELSVPNEAITAVETDSLIALADARLAMAANEKLRDQIPPDEIEIYSWYLKATDDPEKRRQILSKASLKKLAELQDSRLWGRWLKEQFEKAEADGRAAVEEELRRGQEFPKSSDKDKWKIRVRILSASHSIRPKVLSTWNSKVGWIKLSAVSGKKDQLLVEFTLKNRVPIQGLWYFGWGLARQFVVALNIGSMGFWWWRLPDQISRYYDSIEDLERKMRIEVHRSPSLKVDWGENRTLTEEELNRVMATFVALPGPGKRKEHAAYDYYIGGLTFLSLNDIHWQCELQAFGNFFESLKAMMAGEEYWKDGSSFESAFLTFLDDLFPQMDERDRFAKICRSFEEKQLEGLNVNLKEASFMKLFCDAYFLRSIQPKALQRKLNEAPEDNERSDGNGE